MKLAVLALVSITTFFGSPALSSLILCLGNDGHVEWEYSVNGRCGSNTSGSQDASLHDSEGESHCGPCIDLSLNGLNGSNFLPAQGWEALQLTSLSGCLGQIYSYPNQVSPEHFPQPPPQVSYSLVQLRTIRLLV